MMTKFECCIYLVRDTSWKTSLYFSDLENDSYKSYFTKLKFIRAAEKCLINDKGYNFAVSEMFVLLIGLDDIKALR